MEQRNSTKPRRTVFRGVATLGFSVLLGKASFSSGFVPNGVSTTRVVDSLSLGARPTQTPECPEPPSDHTTNLSRRRALASLATAAAGISALGRPCLADEYGRETEMDILFTGEGRQICTKRGPLGACLKTELRTSENDNDKAEKYFREPTDIIKRKDLQARQSESAEGNELIARLRQQSEDNYEKNQQLVYQRTQMNDAGANFGPFDGNVLILNEDGKGFTLLENPQAMRLKKAGFIEGKKFVKQPTEAEIEDALEAPQSSGFFGGLFGGGD